MRRQSVRGASVVLACVVAAGCGDDDAAAPDAAIADASLMDTSARDAALPCTVSGCPMHMFCNAARECAPGCLTDDDCASESADASHAARCDRASNRCVACNEDIDCSAGMVCVAHACAVGCNDAQPCARGETCCAGACVDPQTNDDHCGACGSTCAASSGTAHCASGVCAITSCTPPWADCDGIASTGCEVDTRRDAENCGGCGIACATAHGSAQCTDGVCAAGLCDSPYDHCALDGTDCEANLTTNVAHCGDCATKCAGDEACVSGHCGASPCGGRTRDCDGDGSCESSIDSDRANCGGCGNACALRNATSTCAAGLCAIAACTGTFADCDGSARDGCEVDLASDPLHCGACSAASCSGACGTVIAASMLGAPNGWTFYDDAFYDSELGSAVLTPYLEPGHTQPGRGALMYNTPIALDAFVATFDVRIGNQGGQPGEGLAMVLSATPPHPGMGGLGSGLGAAGLGGYGVELDTRANACDGEAGHIGIDELSIGTCATDDSVPRLLVYSASLPSPLSNSGWHSVVVRWNGNVVSVTFDGTLVIDSYAIQGLVPGGLHYFGFTAAYSAVFTCRHEIRNVRITLGSPRCL